MADNDSAKLITLEALKHYNENINNTINEKLNTTFPVHYGTTEYWNSQTTLVGEKSHIYIYSDYATVEDVSVPNIKIGDGSAYLIDNPFITTSIEDLLQFHIEDNIKHITEQERTAWNNKVSCHLSTDDSETIVFTTE
ncbi:MAG: hypothetical protein ACI4KR_09775 [Ruminiclostridium sp.]